MSCSFNRCNNYIANYYHLKLDYAKVYSKNYVGRQLIFLLQVSGIMFIFSFSLLFVIDFTLILHTNSFLIYLTF